jgi:hypothetical protein
MLIEVLSANTSFPTSLSPPSSDQCVKAWVRTQAVVVSHMDQVEKLARRKKVADAVASGSVAHVLLCALAAIPSPYSCSSPFDQNAFLKNTYPSILCCTRLLSHRESNTRGYKKRFLSMKIPLRGFFILEGSSREEDAQLLMLELVTKLIFLKEDALLFTRTMM